MTETNKTEKSLPEAPDVTLEEKQAIEALGRLSRRWPKSLSICVADGKTAIMKNEKIIGVLTIPHL